MTQLRVRFDAELRHCDVAGRDGVDPDATARQAGLHGCTAPVQPRSVSTAATCAATVHGVDVTGRQP
jgi:hypothetical protein